MSVDLVRSVLVDSATEGKARLVMLVLAEHANVDGIAWPSPATIAAEAKVSVRWVRRCIKAAVKAGELVRVTPGGGRRKTTKYRITVRRNDEPQAPDSGAQTWVPRPTFSRGSGELSAPKGGTQCTQTRVPRPPEPPGTVREPGGAAGASAKQGESSPGCFAGKRHRRKAGTAAAAWDDIDAADLKTPEDRDGLYKAAVAAKAIGDSQNDRSRFHSACLESLRKGRRPGAFLRKLIRDGLQWNIPNALHDEADAGIKKLDGLGKNTRLVVSSEVMSLKPVDVTPTAPTVPALSEDAKFVSKILAALKQTRVRGDPFNAVRAAYPDKMRDWTRQRWKEAEAELDRVQGIAAVAGVQAAHERRRAASG